MDVNERSFGALEDALVQAGQADLAAAVLHLLSSCSEAAVTSLNLPGLLLSGSGNVSVGLAAGMKAALQRGGKGQLLVLHLPRIEVKEAKGCFAMGCVA
eukprot:gene5257-5492_t